MATPYPRSSASLDSRTVKRTILAQFLPLQSEVTALEVGFGSPGPLARFSLAFGTNQKSNPGEKERTRRVINDIDLGGVETRR